MLSLLLPLSSSRSQTHTLTPTCRHARRAPLPLAASAARNWRLLSSALAGRVWRQEKGRDTEAEDEDEKVEEEDVDMCDDGRQKRYTEVD